MSGELLELLVDENNIDLPRETIRKVKALISEGHGVTGSGSLFEGKRFLTQIVANNLNRRAGFRAGVAACTGSTPQRRTPARLRLPGAERPEPRARAAPAQRGRG